MMVAHSLFKSTLFLLTGVIDHQAGGNHQRHDAEVVEREAEGRERDGKVKAQIAKSIKALEAAATAGGSAVVKMKPLAKLRMMSQRLAEAAI